MSKEDKIKALPEKLRKIVEDINLRQAKARVEFSPSRGSSKGDVTGNTSSCNDVVCGGGTGNVSACDEVVCNDPNSDPGTSGNTSACGDWVC